jgi:hypothetical protein
MISFEDFEEGFLGLESGALSLETLVRYHMLNHG